ncbi:hypothetical protein HZC30_07715 [Candidatus Woesearchaeota archaeon]|nr:hypothetical protein [Candidatus Woesearchaeota archaeon]
MEDYNPNEHKGTDFLSAIMGGSLISVVAGFAYLTVLTHTDLLTPPGIPQQKVCQTVRVGENEELADVVQRMKVYDSTITVEKLAEQNNLMVGGKLWNVAAGAELKYCYGK